MIAVIDTETNWLDQVMSIGVVTAEENTLEPGERRYYILTPEAEVGGMYEDRMALTQPDLLGSRDQVMGNLVSWLQSLGIREIFAYNARFDCTHLPELGGFCWYDIMRLAAYRQYNASISPWTECCSTGRLKRGYGVEPVLRALSNDPGYGETHNALLDAVDELQIMKLLSQPLCCYREAARL